MVLFLYQMKELFVGISLIWFAFGKDYYFSGYYELESWENYRGNLFLKSHIVHIHLLVQVNFWNVNYLVIISNTLWHESCAWLYALLYFLLNIYFNFFIKVHNLPTHEDQITFNTQNNINSLTFFKIYSHSGNFRSNTPIGDSAAVETSELTSSLDWLCYHGLRI